MGRLPANITTRPTNRELRTMDDHNTNYDDLDTQRLIIIEYMRVMIARGDWHGVSDAANDLRVLKAEE